jgi:hypothetical protein
MGLRINVSSDPTGIDPGASILASCDGSRKLQDELRRYCNGQLDGRSFLVAGLRGSGKTWLVEGSVAELQHGAALGTLMRALRVPINGPHIFQVVKNPPATPAYVKNKAKAPDPAASPVSVTIQAPPAPSRDAASLLAGLVGLRELKASDSERLFQHLLETVVLSLHSALSAEYVRRFRAIARQRNDPQLYELAATLEITLPEGPSPADMREFWHRIDAIESGVVFPGRPGLGRGMRELSALSGVGYAYKRVAGEVRAEFKETQSASQFAESSGQLWATQIAELAKPLTVVLTGAFLTAGTASPGNLLPAALLGLAASALSLVAFRLAGKRQRNDETKRDFTFLPKTDASTLERVLPELLQRLKLAGLAPVIVVDELDKIDNLWTLIEKYELLDQFKKLFAERVFTCFLVNRSFMEELAARERQSANGKWHSYFSQRVFVSFEPTELHDHLDRLMEPFRG